MSLISAFRKQSQVDLFEFETSLVYLSWFWASLREKRGGEDFC